jgi:hypothetical protein
MSESVADGVDRLFGLPLGEFVAARNELARRLRKEGQSEDADRIAGLRKPSTAVWTVNQLARRHRRDVDLLLDAGHRLRAAHSEGQPEKARQAIEGAREAEREVMKRLSTAAGQLLEEEQGSASRATIDRVRATLQAAAVTEEGRELLARGRLTEELSTTGFDLIAELVPKGGSARPAAGRKPDAVAEARAALKEAKARERESARRVRDAEGDAGKARRALDAAEAALEAARTEAEEAASAVRDAESALKRAQRRR